MFFWIPAGGPHERIAFIIPFEVDLWALVPGEPLALVPIGFATLLALIFVKARQATRRHAAMVARASKAQTSKEKDLGTMPDAA